VIALTYGSGAEWVKNVLAAGVCRIETRGVVFELSAPNIIHDPTRQQFPPIVRVILRIVGASDFMQLSISTRRD
jgi:hypothetical protein